MVGGRRQPECREYGGRSGIGVGCWRHSLEAGDPVFLPPKSPCIPTRLDPQMQGPQSHHHLSKEVGIWLQDRIKQCEVVGRAM